MKDIVSLFLCITIGLLNAQDAYENEILEFQSQLNAEFRNPEKSPLTTAEQQLFKGHNYFPIDENYKVTATFVKSLEPIAFQMQTTTSRLSTYDIYGVLKFSLLGVEYELAVYQNHRLRETEEYRDYLFLPFTDLTNGEETYGGGRYIDLSIPDGEEIVVDFNKAYSPSCAYNKGFSCPIPPETNDLQLKVKAGVKNLKL